MASHFTVSTVVRADHLRAFHLLIGQPGLTIDQARAWLKGQGYNVSRSAVGRYVKMARAAVPMLLRSEVSSADEPTLRARIADWADRLDGPELVSLGMFAAFLAFGRTAAPAAPAAPTATDSPSQLTPPRH